MKKYKAYCTDLDGTLFDNEGRLSPENEKAIEELVKMGVIFVPTTGRTIKELPPCIKNNENVRYIIYSNGAGVLDRYTGWKSEELVEAEKAEAIFDILSDYNVLITVHKDTDCFINGEALSVSENYSVNGGYIQIFKTLTIIKENFMSFAKGLGAVEMICVFFGKDVNSKECISRLQKISGIAMTSSISGNVEIISESTNKGSGVRRLAEHVGISSEEIIGVGDQKNDIDLLNAVGCPLAVSNASHELKAVAKEIICKNTEHSVKYVLDKFFK